MRSSRLLVLELVLVISLTTTAAVIWEFAEFSLDRVASTNVQVSLANTMQDLALGILGAFTFVLLRGWTLRASATAVREVAGDWVRGRLNTEA